MDLLAAIRSERERAAVAAALVQVHALNKLQRDAFFGIVNLLVFMSPHRQRRVFRDFEDIGLVTPAGEMAAGLNHEGMYPPVGYHASRSD